MSNTRPGLPSAFRAPSRAHGFSTRAAPALILLLAVALFQAACADPAAQSFTPERAASAKMDSALNGLVAAEKTGTAPDFAARHGLALTAGRVRIIIECLPGQTQAVYEAVATIGTIEAVHQDTLQALVPVPKLDGLAGEAAVRFIRIPTPPLQDSLQ